MADAGYRLQVDGEKEFKQALADITAQVKLSKSEIRALTAEYNAGNDDITKAVAAHERLKTSYDEQTVKVAELSAKYTDQLAAYGETDTYVQQLAASLQAEKDKLAETAEQYKTTGESIEAYNKMLETHDEAIEKQREKVELLRNHVQELTEKYGEGADITNKYRAQLAEARTELANMTTTAEKQRTVLTDAQSSTAQYEAAVKELTAKVKDTDSSMRELTTRYNNAQNSTEYLAEKNRLLNDRLEAQRGIVTNLETALEKTRERYGENSEEVEKYKEKLAEAKTELTNIDSELKNNKGSMDELNSGGSTLNDTFDKISEATGIQIPSGLRDVVGGIDNATAAGSAMLTMVTKIAEKAWECATAAAAYADNIATDAAKNSLTTYQQQVLEYIEPYAEVSAETMGAALSRITRSARDAAEGNERLRQAYEKLGVKVTDSNGALRDNSEIALDVIDGLNKMENETERDAIAMDIMGRSARELNPLIVQGADAIREWVREAEAMGYIRDDAWIERGNKLQDMIDKITQRIQAAKMTIGDHWLEAILSVLFPFVGSVVGSKTGFWEELQTNLFGGTAFGDWAGVSGGSGASKTASTGATSSGTTFISASAVSAAAAGQSSGGTNNTYNINIDAKNVRELNDVVRAAETKKQQARLGYVGY